MKYIIMLSLFAFYSSFVYAQNNGGKAWWQTTTSQQKHVIKRVPQKVKSTKITSNPIKEDSIKETQSIKHKLEGSEIFELYSKAVFMVFTKNEKSVFQGSGFFINDDGLAVTNYHLFEHDINDAAIKLANFKNFYEIDKIIWANKNADILIFKIDGLKTPYIPIAPNKPKVGDKVFTIGSPQGLENTFSSGEISQWRTNSLMQISNPIDHGSSGGALINEYGEIVGITSGTLNSKSNANLNYAISTDIIKTILNKNAYTLGRNGGNTVKEKKINTDTNNITEENSESIIF